MVLRRVVPEVITLDLGYLRMWRDDLGRMVSVLEQISKQQITMTADDYELDRIQDLAELAEQKVHSIRNFSFTGGQADEVKLQLGENASLLQIIGDDLAAKGAAQEIYEIALNCRRVVVPDFSSSFIGSLLAVTPVVGGIAHAAIKSSGSRRPNRHVILDTRTRDEAPSFWREKKRDVWITAVSNVVALLLGGVIGYFINIWTNR